MDTPEFNQRFGILLEAYLRGCGEAMFTEIQHQHKAVCDIMQVAASVSHTQKLANHTHYMSIYYRWNGS